ncbi:MAG: SDR family oxidoreductase [Chloroflexota bacterium]|nr:SDR family oxidoreductase [Chloroflexota bacterium]
MRENNQTALITGPSSGIGEEFAKQLAAAGYNLVLVARSEGKLASMCEQLAHEYGITTHFIVADLAQLDAPEMVFQQTTALDIQIDLLINNAGIDVYAPFAKSDWGDVHRLINLNVNASLHLTHLFLPGMIQRNQGYILNLGSIGSFIPGPNNSVYAATKALVRSFSRGIAAELRGTNVGVSCLCPGAVRTAFADKSNLNGTILFHYASSTPEAVAAAGIRAIQHKTHVCVPGFINQLIVFFYRFVPGRWMTRISKWAMVRR